MSYHKYSTLGLIVATYPRGESDRTFSFYTRELGLVHARAKSIREERSRLRYTFQTFSIVSIELIRGKLGWRVASGRLERRYNSIVSNEQKRVFAMQYLALMSRLITGTETHIAVFDETIALLDALEGTQNVLAMKGFELVSSVSILSLLGYWRDEGLAASFQKDFSLEERYVVAESLRGSLVPAINNALRLTQL